MKRGNATLAALAATSILSLQLIYCVKQSSLASQSAHRQCALVAIDQVAGLIAEQLYHVVQTNYETVRTMLDVHDIEYTQPECATYVDLDVRWRMRLEQSGEIILTITSGNTRGMRSLHQYRIAQDQHSWQLERVS